MARIESPMKEQVHLPMLNENLEYIEEAQKHIDQAKRAGIDVSAAQAVLDKAKAQTLQVKNAYFPGR